jgi:mannan endo-1,4-beta-mannosidase
MLFVVISTKKSIYVPYKTAMALRSFALLLILVTAVSARSHKVHPGTPADGNASTPTRNVLNYLANLPSRNSKRVVSGQLVFYAGRSNFPNWWTDVIQQSGFAPGLMHAGNRCTSGCSIGAIPTEVLQSLINHWNAGGLVMVSVHHSNPLTGGSPKDTSFSSDGFTHLLTPGDPVYAAYLAELDVIARQLQTLQNAGVVVLFRPLLEMNGNWYWWSAGTTAQYVRLWRMEFDYLTRTKGLHNLLFVWTPNAESGHYAEYYPGDAYVDIAGLDFYHPINGLPVPKIDGYNELTTRVARSKPFGLAEFGPLGPDAAPFTPEDYYQLIAGIKRNMPRTTFWASHWEKWSMGLAYPPRDRHLNVAKLLADPWVVNEGDINFSDSSLAPAGTSPGP